MLGYFQSSYHPSGIVSFFTTIIQTTIFKYTNSHIEIIQKTMKKILFFIQADNNIWNSVPDLQKYKTHIIFYIITMEALHRLDIL